MAFRFKELSVQSVSQLRIHPPDVIGKYAPEAIVGKVGSGGAAPAPAAPVAAAPAATAAQPLLNKGGHEERMNVFFCGTLNIFQDK